MVFRKGWLPLRLIALVGSQNMNREYIKCVYCNQREKETDDHVPPKSFYPMPRPSNLITVPSCLKCNRGLGKDEEFFLATFMFSHAGESSTGKQLWDKKINRMYEKNLGLRRKIAGHLQYSELLTPSGIFLGRKWTIKTDEKRFEKVVNKILRGLYFFEYNEPIPDNAEIMTLFLNQEEKFKEAGKIANELKLGSRIWNGIFEYKFNRVAESPTESMWLFRFWGYANFWSVTYDKEMSESQQAGAPDRQ